MPRDLSEITVSRTKIPHDLEVHEELGKGSNNKVFAATYKGEDVVFRVPRRRSDTQQHGSAHWEYQHMKLASECNVAPKFTPRGTPVTPHVSGRRVSTSSWNDSITTWRRLFARIGTSSHA